MAFREYFTSKDARAATIAVDGNDQIAQDQGVHQNVAPIQSHAGESGQTVTVIITRGPDPRPSRFRRVGSSYVRQREHTVDINEVNSAFDKAMKTNGE